MSALQPQPLLFFPDHGADPLWADMGTSMVSLELLPLTAGTRTAVREWAREWDRLAQQDLESDPGVESPGPAATAAEWRACMDRVPHVVGLLRGELGPSWLIGETRFDGGGRTVRWEEDGPWQPPAAR